MKGQLYITISPLTQPPVLVSSSCTLYHRLRLYSPGRGTAGRSPGLPTLCVDSRLSSGLLLAAGGIHEARDSVLYIFKYQLKGFLLRNEMLDSTAESRKYIFL